MSMIYPWYQLSAPEFRRCRFMGVTLMVPGGCSSRPADDPPLPNPPTIEFD